jgi:HK97 family phage major capsid protein
MSELKSVHDAITALASQTTSKLGEVKSEVTELSADFAKLQGQVQSMGQEMAGGSGRAPMGQGERRSLAGILTKADEFQAFKDAGKRNARAVIAVKADDLLQTKSAPIVGDGDNLGVLSQGTRLGIVQQVQRRSWVIDGMPRIPVTSGLVEFAKETFTGNAGTQTDGASDPSFEGTLKAYNTATYDLVQTSVRTIAHFVKVSNQSLADAVGLRASLDNVLRYRLMIEVERQLLEGDGATELEGMLTTGNHVDLVGVQSDDTAIDKVHRAITQLAEADYEASVIVMSPTAWQLIALLKDGENRYIHGQPATGGPRTLWGRPVVTSPAMGDAAFIVADLMQAATVAERQDATVELGYSGDDFTRNLVTIRAELRLAQLIQRPGGIIVGTF